MKNKNQIVGLNTLNLRSVVAPAGKNTRIRPTKKRVFTDDEVHYLNTLSDLELMGRIKQGYRLIDLLQRPEMMNMNKAKADATASNLRFQIDFIHQILKTRKEQNG